MPMKIKPVKHYSNPRVPLEDLLREIDKEELYLAELEERGESLNWEEENLAYQFITTYTRSKWRLSKLKQVLHSRLVTQYRKESSEAGRILKELAVRKPQRSG